MMYLSNAGVIGNMIYSGVLERFPTVKFVSVESGVGWMPFFLESLDYQLHGAAPNTVDSLSLLPSEYFRRQIYGCFWFEAAQLHTVEIDRAGHNPRCCSRPTTPHPTCLYPDPLTWVDDALTAGIDDETKRRDHGSQRGPSLRHPAARRDACLIVAARLAAAGCVAPEDEARELLRDGPDDAELEVAGAPTRGGRAAGVDRRPRPGSVASTCAWRPGCTCRARRPRSWRAAPADVLRPAGIAVDLCTGSGAVAAWLQHAVPDAFVVGRRRRSGGRAVRGDATACAPSSVTSPHRCTRRAWSTSITAVAPYVPTADRAPAPVRRAASRTGARPRWWRRRARCRAPRRRSTRRGSSGAGGHLLARARRRRRTTRSHPTSHATGSRRVESWHDDDGDLRGVVAASLRLRRA